MATGLAYWGPLWPDEANSTSGGGGGGETTPPTVTLVSPQPLISPGAPGGFAATWNAARLTPIIINLTDTGSGMSFVQASIGGVTAIAGQTAPALTIFPEYVLGSTVLPIASGVQLQILPNGGWPEGLNPAAIQQIALTLYAIDVDGNLSKRFLTYLLPPSGAGLAPTTTVAASGAADFVSEALSLIVSQFRSS